MKDKRKIKIELGFFKAKSLYITYKLKPYKNT